MIVTYLFSKAVKLLFDLLSFSHDFLFKYYALLVLTVGNCGCLILKICIDSFLEFLMKMVHVGDMRHGDRHLPTASLLVFDHKVYQFFIFIFINQVS